MAEHDSNEDNDPFLSAEKRAILAIVFIILVLFAYILIADIKNTPEEQAAAPQSAPQVVSVPASNVREVAIAFAVTGRIAQMFATEHMQVKKGEVLATLDKAPFEEALAAAKMRQQAAVAEYNKPVILPTETYNAIETARVAVETAQYDYNTVHAELEKRKALLVPGQTDNVYDDDVQNEHDAAVKLENARRELERQKEVATATTNRDADQSVIQSFQSDVAIAETNLAETQLLAPFDAVVSSRSGEVGTIIPAGTTVYTLSVTDTPAASQ